MNLQKGLRLERGSKADWDEVLAAHPGATAFHRYEFLECVATLLRCTFEPLVIMQGTDRAGVAPLVVRKVGPLCTLNWMPFPYLGPLTSESLLPAVVSLLATEGTVRGAIHHQQGFADLVPDGVAGKFNPGTDLTFVVPLDGRSDEALLAAMTRNGRWEISRARRDGVQVYPAEHADFLLMDRWSQAIYARQGLPPKYPAGAYERLFDTMGGRAGSHFHAARLDGKTIAVNMGFSIGNRSFDWQMATDPAHRKACPQALLLWSHLTAARDRGDTYFDLGGAPTDGIAVYKRNFGAVERHYTVLSRHSVIGRAKYWAASVRPARGQSRQVEPSSA
ncbi:MAG TPA: GNAT family N-acetyltransferase [Streptosporangiaceae bacterium]|nr:GNAT family N-acetyltransferase [Streptosporangiaceae bacterium]